MATQPHQSSKKFLQCEAPPAKRKMGPEQKTKKAGAPALAGKEAFTALELDVAEQLIRLSESSASSGGSFSYLRSVDTPTAPPAKGAIIPGGCVDWEEDEDDEVAGRQRRVKRYRLISEIYAATEPIGERSGSSRTKE
ncbi:uncharacterized protein LOC125556506 [Triticum urartu]|nr:uncharacterized protein LOC123107571 [Triticum aestivum]XP_048550432.1 uncharacterized protein LOC125530087 [Triticum urartu]XP_048575182.1 uncharacterized protein LOC125556502 [Triticum urartu]XP_048575186.1 uncharacterized protein LOC125556506 [Triticum urartu]